MKQSLLTILITVCICEISFSQTDTASLLRQAETNLREHIATVSAVLADKSFATLHPLSTFRETIRKYCTAGILTITDATEPGKKIKITAVVKNKEGQPVGGALIYLYQTDARGWYAADAPHVLMNEGDYRHARLFGYVKTDDNGRFELHTIKPSGYPQSDLPAHIHVHIAAAGYQPFGTEFLFEDDERLKGEILNRAIVDGGMIAKPEPAESPFVQQFSYEIKLRRQ